MKQRLDHLLVERGMVNSRSQAESYIRLGVVEVDGKAQTKAGYFTHPEADIKLKSDQYVSRAGLKLASVAELLKLDFRDKTVLDVGSSTGGFTDYSLQKGAKKVYAVDVGTNQLHPMLRQNEKVKLHEQTDIRNFKPSEKPNIVVMDVSFISLREILPHIAKISNNTTQIVAMLKPQFEAGKAQVNKGVMKNDKIRRDILKDFETWTRQLFIIKDKADSQVHGEKGNAERFYLLQKLG